MIPKRLKIEGLYSYKDPVELDFGPLLGARLFGIFGAVGSGKSSLLEAITYAIFGDTERVGARDARSYNMMNLQSDRLFIEFDFEAAGRTFRSQTEVKRRKTRFEEVGTPSRMAYEWLNEQWTPCEFSRLTDALGGLSYTNFRRTIIIPQGKFQEFLQLGDKARTTMLEELFQLG